MHQGWCDGGGSDATKSRRRNCSLGRMLQRSDGFGALCEPHMRGRCWIVAANTVWSVCICGRAIAVLECPNVVNALASVGRVYSANLDVCLILRGVYNYRVQNSKLYSIVVKLNGLGCDFVATLPLQGLLWQTTPVHPSTCLGSRRRSGASAEGQSHGFAQCHNHAHTPRA